MGLACAQFRQLLKYDGIATVVAENGIFKLTVVLHPPEGSGASRVSTQNQ